MTRSIPGRNANERNRSWMASMANPTPPAAPAPGVSRSRRPVAASRASAQVPFRASRTATCPGVAPFCGPKMAAAPCGPRRGFETSHATSRSTSRRSRPQASRASIRPRPPSVVALPPMPSVTWRAPPSMAAASRSPVPALVAAIGSRSSSVTRDSPDASAISTTARPPSAARRYVAVICRSSGSRAVVVSLVQPPAASTAAIVPSPPSASGDRTTVSRGRARDQPVAIARATSTDVSDPLNESGATRTVRPASRLTVLTRRVSGAVRLPATPWKSFDARIRARPSVWRSDPPDAR